MELRHLRYVVAAAEHGIFPLRDVDTCRTRIDDPGAFVP
jgi:hypothetical protein